MNAPSPPEREFGTALALGVLSRNLGYHSTPSTRLEPPLSQRTSLSTTHRDNLVKYDYESGIQYSDQ